MWPCYLFCIQLFIYLYFLQSEISEILPKNNSCGSIRNSIARNAVFNSTLVFAITFFRSIEFNYNLTIWSKIEYFDIFKLFKIQILIDLCCFFNILFSSTCFLTISESINRKQRNASDWLNCSLFALGIGAIEPEYGTERIIVWWTRMETIKIDNISPFLYFNSRFKTFKNVSSVKMWKFVDFECFGKNYGIP